MERFTRADSELAINMAGLWHVPFPQHRDGQSIPIRGLGAGSHNGSQGECILCRPGEELGEAVACAEAPACVL